MTRPTPEERELGRVLYVARLKEAWQSHWPNKDRWPADEAAWRALEHHPSAEIELTIVQTKAALAWLALRFGDLDRAEDTGPR